MLPSRSIFAYSKSEKGFFQVAALLILLTLAVATFVLAGQLKNLPNWSSKAATDPTTCQGTLEIPSCYEDGTPTAIKVTWDAFKNPDRDCNVYLNGADPGVQQVVSTECSGDKTYTYTTDRLLGNPLGNQDIYQLGLDNGTASCTIKQVADIRAEDACKGKKNAGVKPVPPAPESVQDCTPKIQADFGLTFTGFSVSQSCIVHQQLVDLNAKYSLVDRLKNLKTTFESVTTYNPNNSNCQNRQITNLPANDRDGTRAVMLSNYLYLVLTCDPEKTNLSRVANNLWQEYGGVTPATYNPKPLKADPQAKPACDGAYADIPRDVEGEIVTNDYIAALGSFIDGSFLKNYQKVRGNKYCTDKDLYANGANPRHCEFAKAAVLKGGQSRSCGSTADVVPISTQLGVQIDYQGGKVPSNDQYQTLSPKWTRFVYKYQSPANLDSNPASKLVVFNQESFAPNSWPIGKKDTTSWDNYIEKDSKSYLKALDSFVRANGSKVTAIEIWNEPDLASVGAAPSTYIPPVSYAKMLKRSSEVIKNINPNIKVIAGGLAGTDTIRYVNDLKNADPTVFSQVDAISLHPYGVSPGGWGKDKGQNGDLAYLIRGVKGASGKPVWITEIGQNYDNNTQQDYLKNLISSAGAQNVPVLIWYAWSDKMLGGSNNQSGWGLYNTSNQLKPSGEVFKKFSGGQL